MHSQFVVEIGIRTVGAQWSGPAIRQTFRVSPRTPLAEYERQVTILVQSVADRVCETIRQRTGASVTVNVLPGDHAQ
jgi:hypothetical protein